MNAAELEAALYAAKTESDAAFEQFRQAIRDDAEADDVKVRAVARAYISCREQAPKATVAVLDSMVDLETADVQKAARMAEGLKRSAQMAADASVRWLSSLQSIASLSKEEAKIAAWEPREVAAP